MSEYTCVPAEYLKKLPPEVPLDIGALVEPLAVGWHAVSTSPFKENDDVLVLGGGPIGLSVILALLAKGCKNVIVAEVRLVLTRSENDHLTVMAGFEEAKTVCA
jgi:threonine dehydrogenase-like Zn-dependent dehydrogenase